LPSGIVSYEDYIAKNKVKAPSNTMDQGAFLTLFTTQLKNQNPLDPVKNEAFVAQLAQFSQLEATSAMKNSMETMVKSLEGDKMLAGAAMAFSSIFVVLNSLKLNAFGRLRSRERKAESEPKKDAKGGSSDDGTIILLAASA
jgi:flagellar basal-body rod modification protein FlgD